MDWSQKWLCANALGTWFALSACAAEPTLHDDALEQAADTGDYEDELATDEPSVGHALGGMVEPPVLDTIANAALGTTLVDVPVPATRIMAADDESRVIVGRDNRTPVANTRVAPFSTVVALFAKFPRTPEPILCTGSIVGPSAVLTAAHCIYDAKLGGFAESTLVVPATYPLADTRPAAPFGSSYGVRGFVPDGYKENTEFWKQEPFDYGVVRLKHRLGEKTGVRTIAVMKDAQVGRTLRLVGYHEDKWVASDPNAAWPATGLAMQSSDDSIRKMYDGVFNHYADSNPGSSGSPLVGDGAYADSIVAVHVAGKDGNRPYNLGVLIDAAKVAQIRSWSTRVLP